MTIVTRDVRGKRIEGKRGKRRSQVTKAQYFLQPENLQSCLKIKDMEFRHEILHENSHPRKRRFDFLRLFQDFNLETVVLFCLDFFLSIFEEIEPIEELRDHLHR